MAMCKQILFFALLQVVLLVKSEELNSVGRDFHGYFHPEEEKKLDYQVYQHPNNFYPVANDYYSECIKNPFLPFLGKGVSLLVLKLGVLGIIKGVLALLFFGFLAKLPLLLLKAAFLKTLFLPTLAVPLLVAYFMNQMNQQSDEMTGNNKPDMSVMSETDTTATTDGGRAFNDNVTNAAWESVRMFAETDQCVERISCMIGASNEDSSVRSVFSRMLKLLHHSSPPGIQERVSLIRDAFNKGIATAACSEEDFKCRSPELLIQQGSSKIRLL